MPILIKELLPEIFAALLCAACVYIGYIKGEAKCELSHAKADVKNIIIGIKDKENERNEVNKIPNSSIDDALTPFLRPE